MKPFLTVMLAAGLLAGGCSQRGDPGGGDASFEDLTRDPEHYDGRHVSVVAGYFGAFEVSVLTSGFAESFPPQPTEPTVWVDARAPEGQCVERAEKVTWSEGVVAEGTFRYDPDGGFGHLGAYEMSLQAASLSCT